MHYEVSVVVDGEEVWTDRRFAQGTYNTEPEAIKAARALKAEWNAELGRVYLLGDYPEADECVVVAQV